MWCSDPNLRSASACEHASGVKVLGGQEDWNCRKVNASLCGLSRSLKTHLCWRASTRYTMPRSWFTSLLTRVVRAKCCREKNLIFGNRPLWNMSETVIMCGKKKHIYIYIYQKNKMLIRIMQYCVYFIKRWACLNVQLSFLWAWVKVRLSAWCNL